jgi:hypothetical protein
VSAGCVLTGTYLTGHESLAGAGWAKKQNILTCLQPKRSLMCRGDISAVLTYLAGHESLAGAGWAEKQNSLDVLTAQLLHIVQGAIFRL